MSPADTQVESLISFWSELLKYDKKWISMTDSMIGLFILAKTNIQIYFSIEIDSRFNFTDSWFYFVQWPTMIIRRETHPPTLQSKVLKAHRDCHKTRRKEIKNFGGWNPVAALTTLTFFLDAMHRQSFLCILSIICLCKFSIKKIIPSVCTFLFKKKFSLWVCGYKRTCLWQYCETFSVQN